MPGTFATDFADWMDYSVTFYPWTGYDKYGVPTYGASSTLYCYRVDKNKLIKNNAGEEVVSSHQLYITGSFTYDPLDKFLPNGADYSPTLCVEHYYNEKGVLELSVVFI